jgi:hypothetical protein
LSNAIAPYEATMSLFQPLSDVVGVGAEQQGSPW